MKKKSHRGNSQLLIAKTKAAGSQSMLPRSRRSFLKISSLLVCGAGIVSMPHKGLSAPVGVPHFEHEKCLNYPCKKPPNCVDCYVECPEDAIVFNDCNLPDETDNCVMCGACASACDVGAIWIEEL